MFSNNPNELFTYTVRAGSRSYYLNVKTDKNNEMYLVIKESKIGQDQSKEVHRIMVFERDFKKFVFGLRKVIQFINFTKGNKPNSSISSDLADDQEEEDAGNFIKKEDQVQKYEMDEFDLNPGVETSTNPNPVQQQSPNKILASLDEELFDTSDLQDNQ